MQNLCGCYFFHIKESNAVCLLDGSDVLYNKFNVDGSSPPNNPPPHPSTDYSCVVATTDHWKVARCDEQHLTVCQSDRYIPPGMTSWQHCSSLLTAVSTKLYGNQFDLYMWYTKTFIKLFLSQIVSNKTKILFILVRFLCCQLSQVGCQNRNWRTPSQLSTLAAYPMQGPDLQYILRFIVRLS